MTTETTQFYATGRRKNAIARVWIAPGTGIMVNGQNSNQYLKRATLQMRVEEPLKTVQLADRFSVCAKVHGGGVAGQAGAVSLGISRALVRYDEKLRSALRRAGLLTRDPRKKERKKFGRKGARRSFQYTKR